MIRINSLVFFACMSPLFATLPYIPKFDSDGRYFVNTNLSAPIVIQGNMSRFDDETDTPVIVQFEDGDRPGWYWNGSDWTTTNIRYNSYHANPHPFWRHLTIERIEEVSTSNPTLPFQRYVTDRVSIKIEQSDLTEAFWMGRESFNLRVKMGHSPEGNDKYLEKLFPFIRSESTELVIDREKTFFQVDLAGQADLNLYASLSNGAILEPEKVSYRLHRRQDTNTLYWRNSNWQPTADWKPLAGGTSVEDFFETSAPEAEGALARLSISQSNFANAYWTEPDWRYYITLRYEGTEEPFESEAIAVNYQITPPAAPNNLTYSDDTLRWVRVTSYESHVRDAYVIALQNLSTGEWLKSDWRDPANWLLEKQNLSLGELDLGYESSYRAVIYSVFYTLKPTTQNPSMPDGSNETQGIDQNLIEQFVFSDQGTYVEFQTPKSHLPDINAYQDLEINYENVFDLSDPQPTFTITRPGTQTISGRMYVGLRHPNGEWLDPAWHQRPDTKIHVPMVSYVTYDIYIQNENGGRRTDIRKMGKVRYIDPTPIDTELYNFKPDDITPKLKYIFDLKNLTTPPTESNTFIKMSYSNPGYVTIFNGNEWQGHMDPRKPDFISITEARKTKALNNIQIENITNSSCRVIIDFTNIPFPYHQILDKTNHKSTIITIKSNNIENSIPVVISEHERIEVPHVFFEENQDINFFITSKNINIRMPYTEWLWEDVETGMFWNGYNWLSSSTVDPWSFVPWVDASENNQWPFMEHFNYAPGVGITYKNRHFKEKFLENKNSKNIRILFRLLGVNQSHHIYSSTSFTVEQKNTHLKTLIQTERWGEFSKNNPDKILLTSSSTPPPQSSTKVLTTQPNISFENSNSFLALQLYKHNPDTENTTEYTKWHQSTLIPITSLGEDSISQQIHTEMIKLFFKDNLITLTKDKNSSYRLCAAIIQHSYHQNYYYAPWEAGAITGPQDWDINIVINGMNLPILTKEQAENFDGSVGVPVYFATESELRAVGLDLYRDQDAAPIRYSFPENLNATAWASNGDVLKPRFTDADGNENPTLFNPKWEIMRWNPTDQAWDLEDIRIDTTTYAFNQNYAAGELYRIVFSAEDKNGFSEKVTQDFGFIRDLSNVTAVFKLSHRDTSNGLSQIMRIKLGENARFSTDMSGRQNSGGFKIRTLSLEQDVYSEFGIEQTVPYPGLELSFRTKAKLLNAENGYRVIYGQDTWTYRNYDWIGECLRRGPNPPTTIVNDTAPFPVTLDYFQIKDTWTGRTHAYPIESHLLVEHNQIFDCVEDPLFLTGTMQPIDTSDPWYYQDQTVSTFALEADVAFNHSNYLRFSNDWSLIVYLEGENGETSVNKNIRLNQYLAATNQTFANYDMTEIQIQPDNPATPEINERVVEYIAKGRFRIEMDKVADLAGWRNELMTSNMLPPNFQDERVRRVRINVARSGSSEFLMSTNPARGDGYPLTFRHGIPAEARGVTQLAYTSRNKERVLFRDDINAVAAFVQELTPNSDLNTDMVDWKKFYWKWMNQGQAWNGQAWVAANQTNGVAIGGQDFLSQCTAAYNPTNGTIRLEGRIPVNALGEAFWDRGNPLTLQLSVGYQNHDGTWIRPTNPADLTLYTTQFTLYHSDNTFITTPQNLNSGLGTQSAQAMQLLREVMNEGNVSPAQALSLSYAPEPMLLDAETVQETSDHLWVIGKKPLLASEIETDNPDLNALECYAWLTIPYTPDPEQRYAPQHLVYLVPYPKEAAAGLNFTYSNRQPVTLNYSDQIGWQQAGNVFWTTHVDLAHELSQLYVVIFIPQEEVQHSPLAELDPESYQENYELMQFLDGGYRSFGTTHTHNRSVEIAHPNPDDPDHSVVTVQFADLTGRTQEVRTMASKAPADMLQNVVISGVAEFDSLGRQTKAGKNLLAAIGQNSYLGNPQLTATSYRLPPLELAAAGSRADTFAAGTRFWHQGNVRPGGVDTLSYILNKDSAPFEETRYEEDPTRSRILASLPMGEKARDTNDPLRYTRYHYLTIRAQENSANLPADLDLVINNLETGNNLLPITVDGALPQPGLTGTLVIDPHGLINLTLTGMEERTLFSIANPDIDLLQAWGFQVHVGENPSTLDNSHIYLPADYASRVGEAGASDRNLVSFQEYDRKGRLVASWPPRALLLSRPNGGPWTIAPVSGAPANLRTRYQYDAHDRLVATIEADAGTSQFVYDRHGRVRLSQGGQDMGTRNWLETIYDRQGRVIRTQKRILTNFTPAASRQTLQAWVDPENGEPPTDFGPLPLPSGSTGLFTETVYDEYDTFNERSAWPGRPYDNGWPLFADLQAAYPWSSDGIRFADPIGQVVEVCGQDSAERFYYDAKGRIICRIYLLAGVNEPQISWLKYDNRDLVTAYYNQTHHQGLGFQYDAFARLVRTHDLTPLSDRMLIGVSHRQVGQDFTTPLATTEVALGPLVDEQANLSLATEKRALTQWSYTPTGHLGAVRFGDPDSAQIENRYRYDVRDWLYQHQVAVGEVPTYSVDLDYFGLNDCFDGDCGQNGALNDGVQRMYDGSIAILSETYHLTTEAESRGSGSSTTIVPQTLRHEFGYDGVYQLTAAYHSWPQRYSQHYRYDRNGNRLREDQSDKPGIGGGGLSDNRLDHIIAGASNRLEYLNANGDGQNWDQAAFGYDSAGNVNHIEHYNFSNGFTKIFDQRLEYQDPRFPQLPTRIAQTQNSSVSQDSTELDNYTRQYRYDHNGARNYRHVLTGFGGGEETYFVPAGNDNAVELDVFGRAKRYYLFNGSERFGYKSKQNTGLYVKDHLGSTKMVIAANRDLPEADQNQIPPAADPETNQGYQPLLKMDFEGDLSNQGLLSEGTAVTAARYLSRDGRRALWFDRGDMVTVADDARTEALTNQFSVMLWLYDEDVRDGDDDHGTMVCVGTQRSIRYNTIHWYLDGAKQPILRVGGGAEGWQFLSQWPTVPHRTWVQLAVTYDGQLVRFYQNGEEIGQPQAITLPALYPAQQIALGDWPTYDGYRWNGGLDQVEIHDRVIALEEVRAHYNQMLTLPVPTTEANVEVAAQPLAYNQIRSLMVQRLGDTDPFGNTLRESYNSALAGDTKEPHQFTGQEREHGTGLTYMGGRWYMPAAGRFMQVDPRRELVNSYSYVANNPIQYVDPDGEALTFAANVNSIERSMILDHLQKLTDNKLDIVNNTVIIREISEKQTKPQGNDLISSVINSQHMNTIFITTQENTEAVADDQKAYESGIGTGTTIKYNPTFRPRVYVKSETSDKAVLGQPVPLFLVLGHELIHSDRANKGIWFSQLVEHSFEVEGYSTPKREVRELDELVAIGIVSGAEITENDLRSENGEPERRDH